MTDRVVLITGAASGIGAAAARKIAGPGVSLLLHSRGNREGLDSVAASAREAGAQAETILGDLVEAETPERLVAAA
jgi:short-subunit dehydrogenase